MRWSFILFFCITTISCCPCRKVRQSTLTNNSEQQRDSIYVSIHDTLYIVERDSSAWQPLPIEHNRNRTIERHSHLENTFCSSDADIDSLGILTHSLDMRDSAILPIRFIYQDRVHTDTLYVYRWRDRDHNVIEEKIIERKYVSWWQRIQIYGFWILAIYIFWRNKDFVLSLFKRII